MGMHEFCPILVASHPRSGTHFLIDLIRANFPHSNVKKKYIQTNEATYFNLERLTSPKQQKSEKDFFAKISENENVIIKTHYNVSFDKSWIDDETGVLSHRIKEFLRTARQLYIYRNPEKVLVSYHQFIENIEGSEIDFNEFLIDRGCLENLMSHMEGWLQMDSVVGIWYDDLLRCPETTLTNALPGLKHVSENFKKPRHLRTVAGSRIQRIFTRNPSSTAIVVPKNQRRMNLSDLHKKTIREAVVNLDIPEKYKKKLYE